MKLSGVLLFVIFLVEKSYSFADARAPIRALQEQERIIGGQTAMDHSHPYIISLQMRLLWARAHFCGGSLLNENWVLTAGHCVIGSWLIRMLSMDAVAGATDVDAWTSTVQIQPIVLRIEHPNYEGGLGPNDIAMLKTGRPFKLTQYVQPIPLPPENFNLNQGTMVLAGWGVLKENFIFPTMPKTLQELDVNYVPYDECYKQVELFLQNEPNPLSKNHICTGPLDGGKAACNGDSGGPLVFKISPVVSTITETTVVSGLTTDSNNIPDLSENDINEIDGTDETDTNITNDTNTKGVEESDRAEVKPKDKYLVGVVSWGASPCGEKGAPTVYSDVSKYLDFISSYINT